MDYVVDAKNKKLGRLASEIALVLQGKRHNDEPNVVVKNIGKISVTGKKAEQKIYYRHTGYLGHLREKKYREAFSKNPSWVLRHAVRGMLPKNFLREKRLKKLIIET